MKTKSWTRGPARPWFLCASLLCTSVPFCAAAVDWNGLGGDNLWSTPANWIGGIAPASANTTVVTFGAAGTTFTPVVDAPWTINRLDLTGATPYLLTGGLITFDGAAPQLNLSGGAHAIANDLSLTSALAFTNAVDLTITGQLSGLGGISKSGPGRLTMANFLMYSGQTTVNGGTLQIGNGVVGPTTFFLPVVDNATIEFAGSGGAVVLGAGLVGSGNVVVSGGIVQSPALAMEHAGSTTITGGQLTATILNNGPLTIAAAGLFESGDSTVGSLAGTGRLDSNGTAVTVGGDGTSTTFSGTLAGLGGLTKVGAGRFTMANFLMYSGQTTVNGGTLQIGNGVVGPTTFFLPVVDNATIEFAGSGGVVVLGAGLVGSGNVVVSGGIVQSPALAMAHAGSTTITGGQLTATILNNGPLTIAAAGLFESGDSTVGSLAGAGRLDSNGTAVTVGGDGTSTTFSGMIAGPGGLTKVGAGRLTLSGVSTFTGGTTVSAGTLLVNGTTPGPVVVNAGGTLGGTGTISGPVSINGGGTLAPGLSPGVTNTGNLTLAGIFLVEIEGTTLGTQYDNTNVTGTVTIAGGTLTLAGAYAPVVGNTFTIITNDGADAVAGTFAGLAEGATIAFNGATLQVTYVGGTGNDVVLTVLAAGAVPVAVPTLSEWGLLILALLMGGIGIRSISRRSRLVP